MVHRIVIQGKMPSLNEYLQGERIVVSRKGSLLVTRGSLMKKKWQSYVVSCIRRSMGYKKVHNHPIDITYKFYEENRKRDKGNIMSFADKIICDALQQTGTIQNDNWDWINHISMEFYIDNNNPRIEVYLHEKD